VAGLSKGEEKQRPVLTTFVFPFSKYEIVLVFVYFNGIFVKLQKY
jgi:hypothetical protein